MDAEAIKALQFLKDKGYTVEQITEAMGETMEIWKVEAEGDTMYIEATNFQAANDRFEKFMGILPESLLTWTKVKKLPKGEELL